MDAAVFKPDSLEFAGQLTRLRQNLLRHPLYDAVQTCDALRQFMSEHVFAVWDFMSLLKRLQQIVTCCEIPWIPAEDASLARLINQIVLGEECDEDGRGGYSSHFELYLAAMEEVGADIRPIQQFIAQLRRKVPVDRALDQVQILPSTRDFVRSTMHLKQNGHPHQIAAAFFYGREDVIPDMFLRLVKSLPQHGVNVERLEHYLHRHIELDAEDHGPLARKLVDSLCQGQTQNKCEATATAIEAISQRIALWDGILAKVQGVH